MTEEMIENELESEQDSQETEESIIDIPEMEMEPPKPEFVPPPKGFLYADVDENHKLIIQNQYEAQLKELPLVEFEQAYDGNLYEKGFAPEKPQSEEESEIRAIRNQYLADTDKYMISDFPISKDEKAKYKAYRQYLRDYTEQESWWENQPLSFEAWKDEQ